MRARRVLLSILVAAGLLASLPASAQQAQTSTWVNMRAGPAPEYPIVVQLPPATFVTVLGCISTYSWCDVVAYGDLRGWVYGANLMYPYQGQVVPIIRYGPTIGLPIVTFILGVYWADHYRHHAWYADWRRWDSWYQRPPAHRPPPPPHRPDYRPPPAHRPPPPGPRPPSATLPLPPGQPPGARPPQGPRPPADRPPSGRPPPGQPPSGQPPSGRPPSAQPPPSRPPSGQPPSGRPPSGPPPSAGQLPAGPRPPAGGPPQGGPQGGPQPRGGGQR